MLKRMTCKNFVHFYKEQDLRLVDGPNICVGQNGSGKSALFEAVRRSMSSSKNIGSPSSHNASEPSLVICYYDIRRGHAHGEGFDKPTDEESVDRLVSCDVKMPVSDVRIKVVFLRKNRELHMDLVKQGKNRVNMNLPVDLNKDDKENLVQLLLDEANFTTDRFLKILKDSRIVEQNVDKMNNNQTYDAPTKCEEILRKHVDTACVVYYPTRSTAPVQWTKSEKLCPKDAKKILSDVQDKSEVLNWYLDKGDSILGFQEKVDAYFERITDNQQVRFKKSAGSGITAYVSERDTEDIALENVSEGIYEAMNCAIILACPDFKTICFDEIGRGMHPQMVERLRDLVLRNITDKVILVTTHKTAFVSAWILPRMMFFKAGPSADSETKIIPGSKFSEDRHNGKVSRLITSRYFSSVFFARRLLLVEGEGDLLFMTALKNNVLDGIHKTLLRNVFETLKTSNTKLSGLETSMLIERFHRFLWPLHILGLNGEANKVKLQHVCEILEIERYFILDFEAVSDELGQNHHTPGSFRQFIRDFGLSKSHAMMPGVGHGSPIDTEKDLNERIREDVSLLETENIFIWKNVSADVSTSHRGSIETALRELHFARKDSTLKSRLDENCVILQWDSTKKAKHRHKLFVQKRLTDENIDNVVNAVLETCNECTGSEFFRLMTFLCKGFLKAEGNL